MKPNKDLLDTAVEELKISAELKVLLKQNEFVTLKDVLTNNISDLRKRDGLSFENEIELFKIVEKNGLEGYWKEE